MCNFLFYFMRRQKPFTDLDACDCGEVICFNSQVVCLNINQGQQEVLPSPLPEHSKDGSLLGSAARQPCRENQTQQDVV